MRRAAPRGAGLPGKLTDLGHRVALCEQLEDPKVARGIVKRDVVRVITPGVILDEESLDPRAPSHVAAAVGDARGGYGFAFLDVTTGDFHATEAPSAEVLLEEIARVAPRELVLGRGDADRALGERVRGAFPRLPRAAVDDGDPAVELPRALGPAFDATILAAAPARGGGRGGGPALRARHPAGRRAAARRPRGLRPRRLAHHRRAGARAPRAGRVAAGAPARRVAHRSARRDAHRDGRAPPAPLAAVPLGRPRRRSAAATTRSSGWSARTPRATGPASCSEGSPTSSGWSAARASAWRRRAIWRCSAARWRRCPRSASALGEAHAGEIGGVVGRRARSACVSGPAGDDLGRRARRPSSARVLRPDAPALTKDGGYVNPGVSAELDELVDIASGGRDRIAAIEARERDAHRDPVAEGQVQQRLRLLHRGDALEPRRGPRRLPAQADGRQRRALRHHRARRVRGDRPLGRRAAHRHGAGDLHRACARGSPPRPNGCSRSAGGSPPPTRWRRWPRSRTGTATAGRTSTTAASSSSPTRATRWSSGWPPPAASSPTTSASIPPPSRS